MKLLEKKHSETSNAIKYIFQLGDNLILEMTYINKDDGKDIICVPSQTSCDMGCKFCHITDIAKQLINRDLKPYEIKGGIDFIYEDLSLSYTQKVLLISYMGCGEPLVNHESVMVSMLILRDAYQDTKVPLIRFAIATSMPRKYWTNFFEMTEYIKKHNLLVKIHFSMHYTMDALRKEWMPATLDILPSLCAMEFYKKYSNNAVEIHYALIEGLNDTEQDAILMSQFLKGKDINVKFLFFNEKPTLDYHHSSKSKLNVFKRYFDVNGIDFEYYIPPAIDIGGSCGQFLMDYYLKYNLKLKEGKDDGTRF